MQPVQDLTIDAPSAARSTSSSWRTPIRRSWPNGRRSWSTSCASCRSSPTSAISAARGFRPSSRSTATRPRASASRRRPSTTRCTTPSASASSRPSSPSRTSTASSSRPTRACRPRCNRCRTIYLPSSVDGGQVPLSAIAKMRAGNRAAAGLASRAIPGDHRLVQPGARRSLGAR
jgi:hypothetical protein